MANWKGTTVPNSGAYQTIYINTALSTEEVVSILEKLNFISLGEFETYPVMSVDYSSTGGNEGVNYSELTVFKVEGQLMIVAGFNPIFDSAVGWYDGIETSLINTREGITFMNATDSDEGLVSVGDQNDKLSSLFSITPFTQDEPITNLPEFLTGIADAIREVKGTTEKINAQNYKPEILKFKELIGSGGESIEIVELTATENGTYDSISIYEQAKIDQNTEFDFALPAEILGIPLNVKKIEGIPFPTSADDINGGKYTINIKQNGEAVELTSQTLTDVYYDEEMMAYSSKDLQFALLWVVDSTVLNQILGSAYFENNSIYMSDQFIQMYIKQGVQIDEWEAICDVYAGEKSVAFKPVIVNVKPKIIDTLTVTKNGTYTVPETNDGYKTVDVQIPLEEALQIYENGTYTPSEGYEGVKKFIVDTPTQQGYIIGNRNFETDIDIFAEGYHSIPMTNEDGGGSAPLAPYQFAGATFYGNVDFSNINLWDKPITRIYLRPGSFAGCRMFSVDNNIIFPSTGLTQLFIYHHCFFDFIDLKKFDTGEISTRIALGEDAFANCPNLETVIINAPELYYDIASWRYRIKGTFRNCTSLKEVVFKNYAGVVFPPMDSFPDNDDLLIYFPDDIVESFKTSSYWTDLADKIRPLSEYGNKPTPYLTFSSPSSFTLNCEGSNKYWDGTLEYSTDASVWSEWDGTSISSSTDGKLYMRGTGNTYITGSSATNSFGKWNITGTEVSCSGNIENLLDYQIVANGEHPIMANDCYKYMFYGCKNLTTPPELPATVLTSNCYRYMFSGCINLTIAPELPATVLADTCYNQMFYNCTSLTTPPELPATVLADDCYNSMFHSCTGLTTAPELPATVLADSCYNSMFYFCTGLTTAPELPATVLADSCYEHMFYNCQNLTTPPELPATVLTRKCYYQMFYACISLTTIPKLPATVLTSKCYYQMFYYCTSVKLSNTQTGDYQTEYRIPTSGNGTSETNSLTNMFDRTSGSFTGTPSINTTYYTSNKVV